MTLVFEKDIEEVGTHAIVIGVGNYPYLKGGSGPTLSKFEETEQLTSSPISARQFADWLNPKFRNSAKPLRSIELLLSEQNPQPFQGHQIEEATFSNIKDAVWRWWDRAHKHKSNMTVFYFCGHGMASGIQLSLMPQDFGLNPHSLTDTLIDFNMFHLGMEQCAARQQVFFVDACREANSDLMKHSTFFGQPICAPKTTLPYSEARRRPTYYSTLPGQKAFGRPGASSLFTDALIQALTGPGSTHSNQGNGLKVSDTSLGMGINFLLNHLPDGDGTEEQRCEYLHLTDVLIHELGSEPIPSVVVVSCDPMIANNIAELSYASGGNTVPRPAKDFSKWQIPLTYGFYNFKAEFPQGVHGFVPIERNEPIYTPFQFIPLKVS